MNVLTETNETATQSTSELSYMLTDPVVLCVVALVLVIGVILYTLCRERTSTKQTFGHSRQRRGALHVALQAHFARHPLPYRHKSVFRRASFTDT